LFTHQSVNFGGGNLWLSQITPDTTGEPLIDILGTTTQVIMHVDQMSPLSQATGGLPMQIQGTAARVLDMTNNQGIAIGPTLNPAPIAFYTNSRQFDSYQYYANNSEDSGAPGTSPRGLSRFANIISAAQGMIVPLGNPVLATPTNTSGGTVANGTYQIQVNFFGPHGGWGIGSVQQVTTTGSNGTIGLSWSPACPTYGCVVSIRNGGDAGQCYPAASNSTCTTNTVAAGSTSYSITTPWQNILNVPTQRASGDGTGGTWNDGSLFGTKLKIPNCIANGTAASPSVASCGDAPAGMFSCATNASTATCQVNTTAVTEISTISIITNAADGGANQLNVTCNTGNVLPTTAPVLASKSAGVSFTINLGTVAVNPGCFEYLIGN
jgi:hypothetical protein